MSLPARGVWIEITLTLIPSRPFGSRSPYGERGLKWGQRGAADRSCLGRSPCGERGLKFVDTEQKEGQHEVAPRTESVD